MTDVASGGWHSYRADDPIEVRIYKAILWTGVLLLVLWIEIVIGIAVKNLLLP